MFLQTVIEVFFYRFLLPKFILKCNGLLLDRFTKTHGALLAFPQQCLYGNCPQMIEKEQWSSNNFPCKLECHGDIMYGKRNTKLFWNFHP